MSYFLLPLLSQGQSSQMQHEQLWFFNVLFPLIAKFCDSCSIQNSMICAYINLRRKIACQSWIFNLLNKKVNYMVTTIVTNQYTQTIIFSQVPTQTSILTLQHVVLMLSLSDMTQLSETQLIIGKQHQFVNMLIALASVVSANPPNL